MNLKNLLEKQQKFDEEHNWPTGGKSIDEFVANLNSDLVGLIGEIGEFSNIVKKIRLDAINLGIDSREKHKSILKEELIDVFIYFMRISMYFDIDIESEYLKKIIKNKKRFKKYELKND